MLYQIHCQNIKTGKSEMLRQVEINNQKEAFNILKIVAKELWETNPPATGEQFVIHSEKSENFWWTEKEDRKNGKR